MAREKGKEMVDMTAIHFRVPRELKDRLEKAVRDDGRAIGGTIRKAIEAWLEERERAMARDKRRSGREE